MQKILLISLMLLLVSGCGRSLDGAQVGASSGLKVWLDQPINGNSQPVDLLLLKAHARNDRGGGISSIAFVVNGTTIGDVSTDASAPLVAAEFAWTPPVAGEYIVQAQASTGTANVLSTSARLCVGNAVAAALSDGVCGPLQPTTPSIAQATVRPTATLIATQPARSVPSASPTASASATASNTPVPPPQPSSTLPVAPLPPTATATPLPSATALPTTATPLPSTTTLPATATPLPATATTSPSTTALPATATPLPPTISPTVFRDTQPPVVGATTTSPSITYYGPCQQGEPGTLNVAVVANDPSGIGAATLTYTFVSTRGGPRGSTTMQMTQSPAEGGTLLSALINVAKEAPQYLGTTNGMITFVIDLSDVSGNSIRIEGQNVEVRACQQAPTVTPVPQDTTPPAFGKIFADPDPVYYGPCGREPTRTSVNAEINDSSSLGSVSLRYRYRSATKGIEPGLWAMVTMGGGQGLYTTVLNVGAEANPSMQGSDGFLDYEVVASDAVGNQAQSGLLMARIIACVAQIN